MNTEIVGGKNSERLFRTLVNNNSISDVEVGMKISFESCVLVFFTFSIEWRIFKSNEELTSLAAYDPFKDTGDQNDQFSGYVHIRIQQRNGRKTLTTVQGMPKDIDLKRVLKHFKKEFACSGHINHDEDMGQIIQVTGDQRQKISEFLAFECIVPKNKIKVHGF